MVKADKLTFYVLQFWLFEWNVNVGWAQLQSVEELKYIRIYC